MSQATIIDETLENTVSQLENKASRIEQSKNTEQRVDDASGQIGRICRRLDDVTTKADELRFYIQLYEGAFGDDGSRPNDIQPQVRTALSKVEIGDDELLEAAQDERLPDLEDQVEDAEGAINKAIESMKEALEQEQTEWKGDLESARELNKIIGGDSSFQELIGKMRGFLDSEMWNPEKDPSQLTAQWQRYERQWEENTGKHGWDTFKQEHKLEQGTIDELKQFGDGDPVRLSDLSLDTLKEIKRVPELESALQIEVRS